MADKIVNGRRISLHLSDVEGMAWGSIDNGTVGKIGPGTGGASWDSLLGKASIPEAGPRTLMYNLSNPSTTGTVWTYNQGLATAGALELWRATGDARHLASARQLAEAALNSALLVRGGVLAADRSSEGIVDVPETRLDPALVASTTG